MADDAADSLLIPKLPDDLSVQCIARVPRSSHPALALVSRSWRSFLRSRRLSALRSQLGATESSLCINIIDLSISDESRKSRWYFLNLRPCRLLPLPPSLPLPLPLPARDPTCAVLGPCLYLIGGNVCYHPYRLRVPEPCSFVQIFDLRLNLWTTGPPLAQPRFLATASTLGARIYVFGCQDADGDVESGVWAEVLDPASGAWASLPRRPAHLRRRFVQRSAVLGGRIILDNELVFDPDAAQPWGTMSKVMSEVLWSESSRETAVVDGVLYMYNFRGELEGYDPAARVWRLVEGVEGELPERIYYPKLTNLRGLLCLVWFRRAPVQLQVISPVRNIPSEVHCMGVEITQTRCNGFRGSIAWREVVAAPFYLGLVKHSVVLEF